MKQASRRRQGMVLFTLVLLLGASCHHQSSAKRRQPGTSSPAKAPEGPIVTSGPRLIRDGHTWSVTHLSADAAAAVEQGRLFAILQPIPGTTDQRPIAVFRALGPSYGRTVDVGLQCTALGRNVEPGMAAVPLASNTTVKVGQCLARIVGQDVSAAGAPYVLLDVGSAAGLRPGDEYILLGTSMNADGFVPLGIDTHRDGRCQISSDPTYLRPTTAHCFMVRSPPERKHLRNGFAVFVAR